MGIADELARLEELRSTGALSEHEFQSAKRKVLTSSDPYPMSPAPVQTGNGLFGIDEKTFCSLMHLSQLLVFAGGVGIVVPIVMWIVGKDQSRRVNQHGIRIMNWLISSLIYGTVAGVLCFVLVGFPILLILLILDIIFPIMGAMKASDDEVWSYPGTIRFIAEADDAL